MDISRQDSQFVRQIERQEGNEHRIAEGHKEDVAGQNSQNDFPIHHIPSFLPGSQAWRVNL